MLKSHHFINGRWIFLPETTDSGDPSEVAFAQASPIQIDEACKIARAVFCPYSRTERSARAAFLRTTAKEIEVLDDESRSASGERERTTDQLGMFAGLIKKDDYLDARLRKPCRIARRNRGRICV